MLLFKFMLESLYTSNRFCYYFKVNIGGMIPLSYKISNKYVVVQVYA
jgi:hypothetical protein